VTHKGAAADSGHYIGFVKKSVFYEAKAKEKRNTDITRKFTTTLEELANTPLAELENPDPVLTSIIRRGFESAAADSSRLAREIEERELQRNNGTTDSDSAPVPGPSTLSSSTVTFDSEDDEDWYKFDDDKVSDFPKEKLATLEGGGEDSSAYVLVYRSKVL
jgi:ubiquitin carboxyl-terminal hydrolase 14